MNMRIEYIATMITDDVTKKVSGEDMLALRTRVDDLLAFLTEKDIPYTHDIHTNFEGVEPNV